MDLTEIKPLFDYLDEFRAEINQRFDGVRKRLNNLEKAKDGISEYIKKIGDNIKLIGTLLNGEYK